MDRTVYLAGPIQGKKYNEACDWREYVGTKLDDGIVPLSPMRDKGHLAGETDLKDDYPDHIFSSARNFTLRDIEDVKRADALLVNFEGATRVSIGTVLEIGMARAMDKPVIVNWGAPAVVAQPHDHGMLKQCVSAEVHSLDDGIRLINWILGVGA